MLGPVIIVNTTKKVTWKPAKSKFPQTFRDVVAPSLTIDSAAKAAMALLKNGGSAVDAVELAIMFLEDAEITNAGYGSNLTLDGKVECDASIVDHDGRSGAVGAVSRKVFVLSN